MDIMVELKRTEIHQIQIPGRHWGAGNPLYKITGKCVAVGTYGEEKEGRIKDMEILPMGGGEATISENMEALYASVR